MYFKPLKKLSWMIVLCFALLQVIAPFIHTHSGAEHLPEHASLHVHADEHEHSANHDDNHYVTDLSHTMHTVTVANGLINELDSSLTLYATILVICFLLLRTNPIVTFPVNNFLHDYFFKRRRPAPRAPPQF
jgi:hypothetical protein